jgi:hypothetical protein
MGVVVFNLPGIIMAALAFGIAIAVMSTHAQGTLIGGVLVLVLDLAYRLLRTDGHWLMPNRGGSLFFLPAWFFGVFWTVLGIVEMVRS